jgi:hypothetical protein
MPRWREPQIGPRHVYPAVAAALAVRDILIDCSVNGQVGGVGRFIIGPLANIGKPRRFRVIVPRPIALAMRCSLGCFCRNGPREHSDAGNFLWPQ